LHRAERPRHYLRDIENANACQGAVAACPLASDFSLRSAHVSTSRVLFDVDGPIASVTFNRPEARNAMTWDMYDALVDACNRADGDERVRVLILRGAGKAFVSGTDIGQFTGFSTRDDVIGYEERLDAVIDRIEQVKAATIAQIDGVATGGGCVIALACDLRVCTPDARFGVPIARTLGNCLSATNYSRLVDLLGPAVVKDMLLTGRFVGAAEGHARGIVTRIEPAETIDRATEEYALRIAANAPLTLRATKEMIRRITAERRLAPGADHDLITLCYTSADFREGVAAFLAKRKPAWTGT
jgi:enoyl-CoA hydratase